MSFLRASRALASALVFSFLALPVAHAADSPPGLTTVPVSVTREIGVSSVLSVTATGTAPLTYQWYRGTASSPTAEIAGATASTYTLASPVTLDTAYYSVKVTNSAGSITSEPILVTYQSAAGSLVSGATPTFAGKVLGILPLPDSNGTVVFGEFNGAYHADGTSTAVSRQGITHVTSTGLLNTTWLGANGTVGAACLDGSSRILVGGTFSNMVGFGGKNALARLNYNGTLDTTFTSPFSSLNATVNALVVDATGRIYIGGQFANVSGQSGTFRLIRLNANLTLDTAFNTAAAATITGTVSRLLLLPGDQILVAHANGLRRLNSDGTLDATFTNPGNQSALSISTLPGTTDFLAGSNSGSVRRLTSTGANVTPYPATGSGTVAGTSTFALQTQADARYFIGGNFTSYNAATVGRFLRLNSDGTSDSTFTTGTGFSDVVNAFALDAQGRLWVGGSFLNYRGSRVSLHTAAGAGSLAVLSTTPSTPADPGAPTPDAFTQYLITAGIPAGQRGTADDPDGDGSSNFDEFTNGTNANLGTDAKFTLSQSGAGFVRTPARVNVPSTGSSGAYLTYTLPAGTQLLVGPDTFATNPSNPTFRGWIPTDYDPVLGYLPSINTTPLLITLNANRRLRPVMGYPLETPLPGFTWRSGGHHLWVGTPDVFAPTGGLMTARATALEAPGQETWLETTVTAPGVAAFNWRLDAATGTLSRLNVTANGAELGALASNPANFSSTSFVAASFSVPGSGPVPLRFRLVRNSNSPNTAFALTGQESAFLANFSFGALGVPGNVQASAITGTSATLSWTAAYAADSYAAEINTDPTFATGGSVLGTRPPVTTASFTGLTAGATYHYRVFARRAGLDAMVSATGSFVAIADPLADFLATAGVPANQRGPNDDPDNDGLSNLLEYALGLAPNSNTPNSLPASILDSGLLTLTYKRAAGDVTYTVETNPSLTNPSGWTSVGVNQGTPDVNGKTTATFPASGPGQFLRLHITR